VSRPCYVRAARAGADGAPPLARRLARYLAPVGVDAVRAALADARPGDPRRTGVFTATGPSRYDVATLGERMAALDGSGPLWTGGLQHLDPFALLKLMSCGVLSVLSMALPAEGPSAHFCDDALGGLAALFEARAAIARGLLDDAVVVACDDLTSDHAAAELGALVPEHAMQRRAIAALHLSASPAGARALIGALAIAHDGAPGPVGGASALVEVVAALDGPLPRTLAVRADRGNATIALLPPPPLAPGWSREMP
jgi:3-oxoacyl-[acyl-carrier-protein] synthase II